MISSRCTSPCSHGLPFSISPAVMASSSPLLQAAGEEPRGGVALLCFRDVGAAVGATDRLIRVADLLAAKPSELAFYPVRGGAEGSSGEQRGAVPRLGEQGKQRGAD
jgi:hypothetical protein